MKIACIVLLLIVLSGCTSKPADASAPSSAPATAKAKVYSMEDVDKDLTDGGVVMDASRDVVTTFFQGHPEYHVCQDTEGSVIAVMRNKKADPKADDQFIVLAFRDGSLANREIGPAMFSVGNLESYCR